MIAFRKNSSCPTSQTLLAFQNGETKTFESESVRRHLPKCDFCSAEVEFYARFPQTDEQVEKADIPPQMFELAEAILCGKQNGFNSLNKLFSETDLRHFVKI